MIWAFIAPCRRALGFQNSPLRLAIECGNC